MEFDSPDQLFLIAQGVHRSVAAREAGLAGILAYVEAGGRRIGLRVIRLEAIVSPKDRITRWDRNRDFWALVTLMGTPGGRATIPAVIVNPVSAAVAARYTRLLDVRIIEDPDEGEP